MVKFKAKAWMTGGSWVITIPKAYIENNDIPTDTELQIEISSDSIKEGGDSRGRGKKVW